jgi:hypothetical protein
MDEMKHTLLATLDMAVSGGCAARGSKHEAIERQSMDPTLNLWTVE